MGERNRQLVAFIWVSNVITDDIVDSRSVGACQKVGEEVHHHQSLLFGLQREKNKNRKKWRLYNSAPVVKTIVHHH